MRLIKSAQLACSRRQAETINCTPITSVPVTITAQGVYCFTGNIATSITGGSAITIAANNVTLDMNGFKLGGRAAGLSTGARGIFAFQRKNITIRNGIVRGFQQGIWLLDDFPYTTSQGHILEELTADRNTLVGIQVEGRGCVLRRNRVIATGGTTLIGDALGIVVAGPGADVLDNRVLGTVDTDSTWGIQVLFGPGSVVEGNRVSGDTSGTSAGGIKIEASDDVLVVGNRIMTADEGIVYVSSTGKYMDNLTSGVATPFTGGTPVGTNN